MAQLPNPFLNSVDGSPPSPTGSAVASSDLQPRATAAQVSPGVPFSSLPSGESEPSVTLAFAPGESRYPLSDGVPLPSLSSMEMEPSVTLAQAPSETEGAVSVSTASFDISHIHEIFHYVRKLMKQPPAFVLDEGRFLADIDEEPLFLRADGYLQRREA